MTHRTLRGAPLLLTALVACNNAGASLTTPGFASSSFTIGFYLDRNANHVSDAGDTVYANARVALLLPGGTDTIRTGRADATGVAFFSAVPVGTYRIAVDRHALPDSIGVAAGDTGTIRLSGPANALILTGNRVIRLGYTEASAAEVRTLPAGKRVVIRGHVVAPRQNFRDSSAFVVDTSGSIRVTSAIGRPGSAGNNIGDSVLVLGTTGTAQGQGVLLNGLFTTIAGGVPPVPQLVSVVDAITAKSGALDAALVQLSNVLIRDTVPATPDFLVKVADPADPTVTTTVRIDQLLNAPHSLFQIGKTGTFRGVLVPVGDGTWVLKPRGPFDIVIN
jgi:hypothetical protein